MRLKSRRMSKKGKFIENFSLWLIRIGIVLAIIWFIWAQSHFILSQKFTFSDNDLPKSLVGYNIVHVSDIKNTSNNVYGAVKRLNPDIIVITGGYSDSNSNSDKTVRIVNKLCEIAPVYYIYNPGDNIGCLAQTNAIDLTDTNVVITPEKRDAETFIKEVYGSTIINNAAKGDEQALAYIQYTEEALNNEIGSLNILGFSSYLSADGEYDENLVYQARDKAYELVLNSPESYQVGLLGNYTLLPEVCKADIDMMMFGGTFGTNTISDTYIKGMYGYNTTQLFVSSGVGNKKGVVRILNFPCVQSIVLSDGTVENKNPLEKLLGIIFKDVGTIYDNDGGFELHTYTPSELKGD